jgi:hypothetical protein
VRTAVGSTGRDRCPTSWSSTFMPCSNPVTSYA